MARSVIGLDIGSSALRAAELSFTRTGVVLRRVAAFPLPEGVVRDGEVIDGPGVVTALKAMWRAERFSTRNVRLGVANQRVIVREVDLPDMPLSDLAQALPFQVQDVLPIPVESAILDFHPVERVTTATGTRVLRGLLVAAVRDMVVANVATVEAAGLVVDSVDLTPFALMRSIGGGLRADAGVEALVEIGARVTNVVVHSGDVPHFVRILSSGGQDLTDAVAEDLGLTPAEAEGVKRSASLRDGAPSDGVLADAGAALHRGARALLDQLRGSLDYYAAANPGRPVERLVLGGGGARLDGLAELVAEGVRLPVVPADATWRVQVSPRGDTAERVAALSSQMAVPVGLALGAAL